VRIVHVPADAPRDIFRRTVRVLTLAEFRGLPFPGEPLDLYQPGATRPVPGVVQFVDCRTGTVGVEPDFQTIMHR
jgi:hypothetical protein